MLGIMLSGNNSKFSSTKVEPPPNHVKLSFRPGGSFTHVWDGLILPKLLEPLYNNLKRTEGVKLPQMAGSLKQSVIKLIQADLEGLNHPELMLNYPLGLVLSKAKFLNF